MSFNITLERRLQLQCGIRGIVRRMSPEYRQLKSKLRLYQLLAELWGLEVYCQKDIAELKIISVTVNKRSGFILMESIVIVRIH